jgi:hypothetical protein
MKFHFLILLFFLNCTSSKDHFFRADSTLSSQNKIFIFPLVDLSKNEISIDEPILKMINMQINKELSLYFSSFQPQKESIQIALQSSKLNEHYPEFLYTVGSQIYTNTSIPLKYQNSLVKFSEELKIQLIAIPFITGNSNHLLNKDELSVVVVVYNSLNSEFQFRGIKNKLKIPEAIFKSKSGEPKTIIDEATPLLKNDFTIFLKKMKIEILKWKGESIEKK